MLGNVQALRALAALAVALSHLTSFSASLAFLGIGTIGVELFFVISGFIMVYITNEREQQPLDFFAHRVVRVVPLYWLLTLAIFTLAWLAPDLLKSTRADPLELAKSLAFIPYVKHGDTLQPLLFQGWTLNFEMVFYLLFAVSLLLPVQRQRVLLVGMLIVGAVIAGQLFAPLPPVWRFYTSPLTLCFALGMVLGLLYPRVGAGLSAAAALAFVALLIAARAGLGADIATDLARVAFAFAVVTAALVCEQRGLVWRWGPVQALGAASYSLYLIHPFAAIAVEKVARKLGLLEGPLLLVMLGAAIAAMIVSGLALYRLVEQPLQRAGRRMLA